MQIFNRYDFKKLTLFDVNYHRLLEGCAVSEQIVPFLFYCLSDKLTKLIKAI